MTLTSAIETGRVSRSGKQLVLETGPVSGPRNEGGIHRLRFELVGWIIKRNASGNSHPGHVRK
jgi:hypothetical protein